MKASRHKLRFPVFGNYPVGVVFCDDIRTEAKRWKLTLEGDEEAFTAITSSGCTCIFSRTPDAETVAHEAYHAIVALLKFSGANADEELVAYHLGYLVGRITKWRNHGTSAVRKDEGQIQIRGAVRQGSEDQGSENLQLQAPKQTSDAR